MGDFDAAAPYGTFQNEDELGMVAEESMAFEVDTIRFQIEAQEQYRRRKKFLWLPFSLVVVLAIVGAFYTGALSSVLPWHEAGS
jgi:hypothetical protein